jgi:hypothetical protein
MNRMSSSSLPRLTARGIKRRSVLQLAATALIPSQQPGLQLVRLAGASLFEAHEPDRRIPTAVAEELFAVGVDHLG